MRCHLPPSSWMLGGLRVVFPSVGSEQALTRLAGKALQDINRLGMGPFHQQDESFGLVVAIFLAVNSLPVLPDTTGGEPLGPPRP